ncbi:MAG: hypothetical protein GC172_06365 [Phycisphaera sp.]|nr:hypothetical protein [Phycisphaera sp.]
MRRLSWPLLALFAAFVAVGQAAAALTGAGGAADASRVRLAQRLVDSAAESIASFAAGGLRIGDPDGGAVLSPTLVVDPALEEALDRATALELLLAELPRPNRSVWRMMTEPPASSADGGEAPRASAAAGFHPSAEADLERLSRVLVLEALLARLGDDARLPADAVRDILAVIPRPPMHPGADGALLSRVRSFERGGTASAAARVAGQRLVAEFESAIRQIEPWRERHELLLDRIASRADGEDGRALVAVAMRVMAAQSGWPPPSPRTPSGRVSTAARQTDPIVRSIRQSVRDGCGGHALAETLVSLRPIRVGRIDSMVLGGDGRLRVGRSDALLSEESIDDWRRAAGLVKTAIGWTGMPARSRPRPPRIRDAPLGFKPL